MSRFSAFGVHIGISLIIFVVLAYLIVFQWYPGMFFNTDGGWRGMRIIFAVDLVLGPVLTLIVFKTGKPGLKLDLALIGMLQIVCLVIGTYIVYNERPLAVVYNDGRFTVMTKDDYLSDNGIPTPDLRHFPGKYPKWVEVDIPTDVEAEAELRTEVFRSGRLLNSLTERYRPFSEQSPSFTENAVSLTDILKDPHWRPVLDGWINKNGGTFDDYRFYTFSTRYTFGYFVYDRHSSERLGLLTAPPRGPTTDSQSPANS